jgi:hypothetical protein
MSKNFKSEHEGQLDFFDKFGILDTELSNNTDGIYNGNIFEFKLNINNINVALFQALKYLNHMRIKGVGIPANILLVNLNQEIAYLFDSQNFARDYINCPPFVGAASKDNKEFSTKIKPEVIKYDKPAGIQRITELVQTNNFIKVTIDIYDVVGWANHFYEKNPRATKIKFFEELKKPKYFSKLIYPWKGKETDFKYIMDLLNDKMHRKELGAFYTPPAYCKKATELVRKAIAQIPKNHNYIILDRCAGTGNLQEFLTDKNVEDITLGELSKYLSEEFVKKYISEKANFIPHILQKSKLNDTNQITLKQLEKFPTKTKIKDYIFDDELSHTIVNTYELKEWVVLNHRIGNKVKMIIPPPKEISGKEALVNGGDALSEQFILGKSKTKMSKEYLKSIAELNKIIKDKKTNIILFENPPYRDSSAANTENLQNRTSKGTFVFESIKSDLKNLANSNISTARDISNQFIWSGWQFYLRKPDDYFVLFSPIKYWKSLGLGDKKFINGFLFDREYFHAGASAISCILWQNKDEEREEIILKIYDINLEKNNLVLYLKDIEITKAHTTLEPFFDRRSFKNDKGTTVYFENDGRETTGRKTDGKSYFNENILGYLVTKGFAVTQHDVYLLRGTRYNIRGFYLRSDNFIEKLPLFAAKLYPQKNWYERDIYFTTADGGDAYTKDNNFLKSCLIFTCLSQRNHCRSFNGSDKRFYRNELCFNGKTVAGEKLKTFKLTETEKELLDSFKEILKEARKTKNYNIKFTYGTYQIDQELNTFYKDENETIIYDYPELNTKLLALKTKLNKYYEDEIQPKLFKYELLK